MDEPGTGARGSTNGRWRRGLFTGGAAFALAPLAVLLLAAPTALGAATPALTLSAPYTHAGIKHSNPMTITGCGNATKVKGAFFNKTAGIGGFSDQGNTSTCTSATSSSVVMEGSLTISIPFHVKTNGTYQITYATNGSFSGTAAAWPSSTQRPAG